AAAAATLPDDVILEILARAADDVVALFRCAVSCKRWLALVADPSFLCRRWPEGARDPGSLLGFFQTTCFSAAAGRWVHAMPVLTHFVPAPRSPLGPRRRFLGSFFPNAGGLLKDAVPLASRSGLLLVRLRSSLYWDDDERELVRLAVCNPLAGTWDELPPLHRG
uniref:F-box domain-containing protein n=1 Tax=Triticum urartu TaxID=4572 RepID=A0A8R7K470_TRIUA